MRVLTAIAALCGMILTVMGAIGAHLIGPPPTGATDPLTAHLAVETALRSWNWAILFGFVHTLAAIVAARLLTGSRLGLIAGWAFLAGVLLFSFSLILKAVLVSQTASGDFNAVTAIAPVGGVAFMMGWVLVAAGALRTPHSVG
jgi:uncharacterized membrane protein YgdD (TMEM256/DUF423 family)